MASRKEYEMKFNLDANLASSYSTSFKAAQKEITQLQNEMQSIHRVQSDISSYQKQQQALERTKERLEQLKQEHDNIQKEINETEKFSSSLANKLDSKQRQIDKTTQAMNDQQQKLDQLGNAMQENGVDMTNLTGESKKLGEAYQELRRQQNRAALGFKEAGDAGKEFGDKSTTAVEGVASALAAAGITRVVREIAEAYGACIKEAGEFEQSMSNVEALSGASQEDMQALSSLAKELGATTKFTALESSEAMGYMGMAGWNAQQMIAGMPGVLDLAAASGEELGIVSDIVTDSLTAFGMTAEDTGRYADVLATAATKANTNVSMMGESFKYAAPLAGALKYDCEDVAVAIGIMANSGIKGSEAGTTLRGMLTRLAKPTSESRDAMEALGISLSDGEGNMYSFMEIMEQMRDSFSGLTEEQKTFYAAELAGQRGMSGLLAIVNASENDFSSLSDAISNSSGAAQRMANIKMDNMAGQMTLMQSAFEAVEISIGEAFTPTLTDAYGEIANVLTGVNQFIQENPEVVRGITAVVGVLGGAAVALTGVAAAIKLIGVVSATVPHLGAIMAVAGGVALLTGAVAALWPQMSEEEKELNSLTASSRENYREIEQMRAEYEEAKNTFGETSEEASRLRYQLDDMEAEFEKNKQTVEEFDAEIAALSSSMAEISASYNETIGSIDDQEQKTYSLIQKLQDLADANDGTKESEEKIRAVIKQLNTELPDLALNYDDVVNGTNNWAEAMKRAAKAKADQAREEERQNTWAEAESTKENTIQAIKEAYEELRALRKEYGVEYNSEAGEWLKQTDNYGDIQETKFNEILVQHQKIEDLKTTLGEACQTIAEVEGEWNKMAEAEEDTGTSAAVLNGVLESSAEQAQELAEAYTDAYNAAYEGISGSFGLFEQVQLKTETTVSGMIEALSSQAEYMASYTENLQKASEMGLSDSLIASLSDGSQESAAYLQEIVNNGEGNVKALNDAFAKVQEGKDKFSNTVGEMKSGFSKEMAEIVSETEKTIQEMDLHAEAAQAGYDTINGFIAAASNPETLARVRSAYSALATQASNAISSGSGVPVPVQENARGTKSASPGFSIVGEEGPELIYLNGGEQILTAAETKALRESSDLSSSPEMVMFSPLLFSHLSSMMRPERATSAMEAQVPPAGKSYSLTLQPVYHINGSETSENLEMQLRQHDEALREMVLEVIEERDADQDRVRY